MLCWFFLQQNIYSSVCVYIYPLLLEPPFHPASCHTSRSSQSAELLGIYPENTTIQNDNKYPSVPKSTIHSS